LRGAVFSIRVTPMNSKAEVSGTSYSGTCPWCQLQITKSNYTSMPSECW